MRTVLCFLCRRDGALASYPNPVCRRCDATATGIRGEPLWHSSERLIDSSKPPFAQAVHEGRKVLEVNLDIMSDEGANPVFIDHLQCWRRYKFGGWITMADPDGHTTLSSFYAHHDMVSGHDEDCGRRTLPLPDTNEDARRIYLKRRGCVG